MNSQRRSIGRHIQSQQQNLQPRRARRAAVLLATAAGLALAAQSARAGNLFWDPTASNGANQGGAGSWDATSNLWFNGSSDVAWPNTSPNADTANFAGAAG